MTAGPTRLGQVRASLDANGRLLPAHVRRLLPRLPQPQEGRAGAVRCPSTLAGLSRGFKLAQGVARTATGCPAVSTPQCSTTPLRRLVPLPCGPGLECRVLDPGSAPHDVPDSGVCAPRGFLPRIPPCASSPSPSPPPSLPPSTPGPSLPVPSGLSGPTSSGNSSETTPQVSATYHGGLRPCILAQLLPQHAPAGVPYAIRASPLQPSNVARSISLAVFIAENVAPKSDAGGAGGPANPPPAPAQQQQSTAARIAVALAQAEGGYGGRRRR